MARLPYPPYTYHSRSTINAIKLRAHSPATADHWTAIGTAHFRSLALPRKERELATLYLSASFRSSYEWDHHIPLSAQAGVTKERREVLRSAVDRDTRFFAKDGGQGMFEERERGMLKFLEAMVRGPDVGDELWEETRGYFSEREIVELISLQVSVVLGKWGRRTMAD